MPFFKPWERKESDRETSHAFKPVQLRDLSTQDEPIIRGHRQLRLLSIYGIGGCSIIELNEQQMDLWLSFAMGGSKDCEGIKLLLVEAIPKAYKAVILDSKDCAEYFFGEHNARVRETKTTKSQIQLCLAREGDLLDILDRAKAERLLMTNTRLLKSKIGKSLSKVGLVESKGGKMEHAFLDFVPDAQIGDNLIMHRNIACENFIDEGGIVLF